MSVYAVQNSDQAGRTLAVGSKQRRTPRRKECLKTVVSKSAGAFLVALARKLDRPTDYGLTRLHSQPASPVHTAIVYTALYPS